MMIALDFARGFFLLPLLLAEFVGTIYCLNGCSWNIGSPWDHPAWIGGVFIWFPIVAIGLSFVTVSR